MDLRRSTLQVSSKKVKPYNCPPDSSLEDKYLGTKTQKEPSPSLIRQDNDILKDLEDIIARIISETSSPNSPSDVMSSHAMPFRTFITHIIHESKERASSDEFISAKQKKIDFLTSQVTWKVVKQSSLPLKANVFGGRFSLYLKRLGLHKKLQIPDVLRKVITTLIKNLWYTT